MLETVSARNVASSTTATPLSIESWESKRYTFRTHLSIQVFGCQRIFRLRKALPGRNDSMMLWMHSASQFHYQGLFILPPQTMAQLRGNPSYCIWVLSDYRLLACFFTQFPVVRNISNTKIDPSGGRGPIFAQIKVSKKTHRKSSLVKLGWS